MSYIWMDGLDSWLLWDHDYGIPPKSEWQSRLNPDKYREIEMESKNF